MTFFMDRSSYCTNASASTQAHSRICMTSTPKIFGPQGDWSEAAAHVIVATVCHDAAQVQRGAGLHRPRQFQNLWERAHALRHLARGHRHMHLSRPCA